MKVQCQSCYCIIEVDDVDMGSAMLCGQCQQVVNVPPSYDSPGVLIGDDFIVRRRLGEGGMGSVHMAHQVSLDREVALKVLHPQFTRDREFVVNFVKEARTAAKLNHPNIVQAYAVGEERTDAGSIYYIAMELIEGESVQDVLRRDSKIEVQRSLEIVRDVAKALDHAWQAGKLIHRDIKPDNIMIRHHDGAVKLADLGLAIPAAEVDNEDEEINATPQYLCPENLLGENMDIRGDIYSLGATLYHMLTGTYPHDGETGIEIARKHINEPLVPPSEIDRSVPGSASEVVVRMMMKNPADRYPGPKALIDAVERALKGLGKKKKSSNTGRAKRKFRGSKTGTGMSKIADPVATPKGRSGTRSVSRSSTKLKRGKPSPAATSVEPAPSATTAFGPPPQKSRKPLFFILGGVAFLAIIIVVAIVANSGPDAPPPPQPAPQQQPQTPAPSDSEKLAGLIAEAEAYASSNPQDVDGQIFLWKKARTEAVTQRSPEAKAIQDKISELRNRR